MLMSLSNSLFGSSEFSLRLPNVLAGVLYLIGCFLIFNNTNKNWLNIFGLLLLTSNPYIIEFFSLARGYGLSFGFMLLSIYYLLKAENQILASSQILKYVALTLLFAIGALYSNLSTINYLISVQVILAVKYYFIRKNQNKSPHFDLKYGAIMLVSCIVLFFEIKYLLKLKELNQLILGASSLMEGLSSLIITFISPFMKSQLIVPTIKIVIMLFISVGVLLVFIERKFKGPLFLLLTLIFLLVTGLLLENILFDTKFPIRKNNTFICAYFSPLYILPFPQISVIVQKTGEILPDNNFVYQHLSFIKFL